MLCAKRQNLAAIFGGLAGGGGLKIPGRFVTMITMSNISCGAAAPAEGRPNRMGWEERKMHQ